jgi:hypothetical protein
MAGGRGNAPSTSFRGLRSRARWIALVAMLLTTAGTLALTIQRARADYQGPDENPSQAFGPLQGAHTYSAKLNNGGGNPDDQDWYYFYVPAAGDKLHWSVSNTTAATDCKPYGIYYCNIYATLEDSSGHQVGGSNSSAGTSGVGPGQTQSIDWTFSSPGKYYIAFIGDGDQLSYKFSVTPAGGVSSTPPGSGGSPTSSLHLKAHQHRRFVDFSLVVPSAGAGLVASLYRGSGSSRRPVGHLRRASLPKGPFNGAIRLKSGARSLLKTRHRLTVHLSVVVRPKSGTARRASKKLVLRHS